MDTQHTTDAHGHHHDAQMTLTSSRLSVVRGGRLPRGDDDRETPERKRRRLLAAFDDVIAATTSDSTRTDLHALRRDVCLVLRLDALVALPEPGQESPAGSRSSP